MLKLVFGASPTRSDYILIAVGALTTAVAALFLYSITKTARDPIVLIVLFALALDVGGGVVANITRSTNDYYVHQPPPLSYAFLAVHIAQPLILSLVLELPLNTAAFLYVYAFAAGVIVVHERKHPGIQKPLAITLLLIGLLIYWIGFMPSAALSWFGALYLIKLIGMFAVDHYAESR